MSPIGMRLGHGNGRTAVAPATNVGADTAPHPLFSPFAAFLPWDLWLSMRSPLRGCISYRRPSVTGSAPCDRSCSEAPSALLTHHTRAPLQTTVPGLPINAQLPCSSSPDSLAAGSKTAGTVFESESTGSSGLSPSSSTQPLAVAGARAPVA